MENQQERKRHHRAKLTWEQVREIRRAYLPRLTHKEIAYRYREEIKALSQFKEEIAKLHAARPTYKELAAKYKVGMNAIYHVVLGDLWKEDQGGETK